jgi:hypothetical protein
MALTKEEFDTVIVSEEGFDQQVADFMWEDRRGKINGEVVVEDAAEILTAEKLRKKLPLVRDILQQIQASLRAKRN